MWTQLNRYLEMVSHICYAGEVYCTIFYLQLSICVILYRAWKKHLRSASKENQLSMYQTLCLLESEVDINQFHTQLSLFTTYWESKEPKFMEYFKEHYQDRSGMISIYIHVYINISYHNIIIFYRKMGTMLSSLWAWWHRHHGPILCFLRGISYMCMVWHDSDHPN